MLKEKFLEFGYTLEQYESVRNSGPLKKYKDEALASKFEENNAFLLSVGYTNEDIIVTAMAIPAIYGLSEKNISNKLVDMESLGFTRDEVIKIAKVFPHVYSYGIGAMQEKLDNLKSLGYSHKNTLKIIKAAPRMLGNSKEYVDKRIDKIAALG